MAKLDKIFRAAVDVNASDIHIVTGEPILIRHLGMLKKLKNAPLNLSQCQDVIFEILTEEQKKIFDQTFQLDFVYEIPGIGRFRGSAMNHQRGISAIFRVIPPEIPTLETLGLPEIVKRILDNHQGMILVTGATGQGKSTTLSAMINYINETRSHHILTIEDPIESIHVSKKGVVNQRQLGTDTLTYGNALKGALRQDPDVIMIGELRDLETMSLSITASETGHLVIGTLSTSSAPKTIERIIDSFPAKEQNQIRSMLSETLKAIITQRLVPAADGTKMVLALEILIGTLSMTNLIRDEKTFQIPSMMQTKKKEGMMLMDDSLLTLVQEGKISAKDAMACSKKPALFKAYLDKTD
jgi:twitching motility protein PilT